MKKINTNKLSAPAFPPYRSISRFFKNIVAGFLKRQSNENQDEFNALFMKQLQDMGDSMKIAMREIVRQGKRRK